jgi:hypothetical protein
MVAMVTAALSTAVTGWLFACSLPTGVFSYDSFIYKSSDLVGDPAVPHQAYSPSARIKGGKDLAV